MPEKIIKPTILVFAGPNGSGKSTITKYVEVIPPYINADDVKKSNQCSDLDAAIKAEELREKALSAKANFTFETVLSTDRNLLLLKRAKEQGYFIKCIYVLTADPMINVMRVKSRFAAGGHDVPKDKVISRYSKALNLIPELIQVCDIFHFSKTLISTEISTNYMPVNGAKFHKKRSASVWPTAPQALFDITRTKRFHNIYKITDGRVQIDDDGEKGPK